MLKFIKLLEFYSEPDEIKINNTSYNDKSLKKLYKKIKRKLNQLWNLVEKKINCWTVRSGFIFHRTVEGI